MKKGISLTAATLISLSLASCSILNEENEMNNSDKISYSASENNLLISDNIKDPALSYETAVNNFIKTEDLASPTVIFDKNDLKVTAKKMIYNSDNAELEISIENDSDTEYTYKIADELYDCISVNGYMLGIENVEGNIEPHKTKTETISFPYYDLVSNGIDRIAELQIGIIFCDDEDIRTYDNIVPIKTTAYDKYDFDKNYYADLLRSNALEDYGDYHIKGFTEEKFFDKDGIKILSAAPMTREEEGNEYSVLTLDIYNDSDVKKYINFNDYYMEGLNLELDLNGGVYILPQKHMIANIIFGLDNYVCPIMEIDTVKTIEFSVQISDITKNNQKNNVKEETFTVKYGAPYDASVSTELLRDVNICKDISESSDNTEDTDPDNPGLIEPTVIYDKNGISVTANRLIYNQDNVELEISIKNLTHSQYFYRSNDPLCDLNSINGYMIDDGDLYGISKPGKILTNKLSFSKDILSRYGIDKIAEMQIGIVFYTLEDQENKLYDDIVTLKTTAYDGTEYNNSYYPELVRSREIEDLWEYSVNEFKEDTILDSEGVKIVSASLLKYEDLEDSFLALDIYNDSDVIKHIKFQDLIINGINLPNHLINNIYILPKKHHVAIINNYDCDELKILGIDEIHTLEYPVIISDVKQDYEDINCTDKTISINFSESGPYYIPEGNVIVNDDNVRVVSIGLGKEYGNINYYMVFENKTGKDIYLHDIDREISVNGETADNYYHWERYIPAGYSCLVKYCLIDNYSSSKTLSSADEIVSFEDTLSIKDVSGSEIEKLKVFYEKDRS